MLLPARAFSGIFLQKGTGELPARGEGKKFRWPIGQF